MNYKGLLNKFILIVFATSLFGCGKPYVGNKVNTDQSLFCNIKSFPAECTITVYEHFIPHVKISKIDDDGNYKIEGYFDPTEGSLKSWGSLLTHQSNFRMIFVSNDIIVDNKNISVQGTDLGHKLTFSFEYHSEHSIDAVAFTYNIQARG